MTHALLETMVRQSSGDAHEFLPRVTSRVSSGRLARTDPPIDSEFAGCTGGNAPVWLSTAHSK